MKVSCGKWPLNSSASGRFSLESQGVDNYIFINDSLGSADVMLLAHEDFLNA